MAVFAEGNTANGPWHRPGAARSDPITDWVYGVSLSPDGKQVAAGTGEGKLYFWNTQDGKLERTVSFGEAKR